MFYGAFFNASYQRVVKANFTIKFLIRCNIFRGL
jgi:hypothetical protein